MTSPSMAVHIVDLDHTLTTVDTLPPFLFGLMRRHPRLLAKLPVLVWHYLRFRLGLIDNNRLKSRFLRELLASTPSALAAQWGRQFAAQIVATRLNRALLSRLNGQRERGAVIALASASPDIYVDELASLLRIEHVICTRLVRDARGAFTGALQTDNCYGEEKLRRVRQWLASQPQPLRTHFYTDHHSDLPLLQAVDHAVMVNPTRALRRHGLALGFELFDAAETAR
jgi:phosphatidylglycerophosphatase C